MESYGRLQHPLKINGKNKVGCGYWIYGQSQEYLISLGDIRICKRDSNKQSMCFQYEKDFNYGDDSSILLGKQTFIPKRIIVIQMK